MVHTRKWKVKNLLPGLPGDSASRDSESQFIGESNGNTPALEPGILGRVSDAIILERMDDMPTKPVKGLKNPSVLVDLHMIQREHYKYGKGTSIGEHVDNLIDRAYDSGTTLTKIIIHLDDES